MSQLKTSEPRSLGNRVDKDKDEASSNPGLEDIQRFPARCHDEAGNTVTWTLSRFEPRLTAFHGCQKEMCGDGDETGNMLR